jgi:hypothetical protein
MLVLVFLPYQMGGLVVDGKVELLRQLDERGFELAVPLREFMKPARDSRVDPARTGAADDRLKLEGHLTDSLGDGEGRA